MSLRRSRSLEVSRERGIGQVKFILDGGAIDFRSLRIAFAALPIERHIKREVILNGAVRGA